MTKHKESNTPSRSKKVAFRILAFLFSFVLIVMIELLLRLFAVGSNYNLFIPNPQEAYSEYLIVNPDVGGKYFQKLEYTKPRNDIFLKKKPDDCFRIMVMGSSSVYGFPYDANLMYSRILHKMLEDHYPQQKFEVINTAITAINSYTLRDYIDEIIEQNPDAILFYAGHNEFYGAFGIGSNETMSRSNAILRLHLKFMDLRLYQLVQKGIHGIGKSLNKNKAKGTLMKRIVKDKNIELNSKEYYIAKEYFSANLETLLNETQKHGIPVFLSDVVSNVKDLKPFDAVDENSMALEAFSKGKNALSDTNISEAKKQFYKARDLDAIRFRATEEFNDIIRSFQNSTSIYGIQMVEKFEHFAGNGIVGDDLMTEHVHPNLQGYFIMAKTFFEAIKKSELIKSKETAIPYSLNYYFRNYGYTSLDELTGVHRVELLKNSWPFTNDYDQANRYRDFYSPASYLDSIAFAIMKSPQITLEKEHLKLAEIFKKDRNSYNAYREFESVLRMNPYLAINYRDAAAELVKLNELPLALSYFETSLEYEKNFFALFKSGEILLLKGDYSQAIKRFEQAFKIAPANKKQNVINKLYMAATYGGQYDKANALRKEIQKTMPGTNLDLPPKRTYFADYIPLMIKNDIDKAKALLSNGDYSEAQKILQQSIKTWRSPITFRMLGDLHFQHKQFNTAKIYYSEAYDHFKFEPRFIHNNLLLYLTLNDREAAKNELEFLKKIAPEYQALKQLDAMVNAN